ncbi:MAG: hypothetical protein ACK5Q5_20765 [Planctomycetaceae bacterium]
MRSLSRSVGMLALSTFACVFVAESCADPVCKDVCIPYKQQLVEETNCGSTFYWDDFDVFACAIVPPFPPPGEFGSCNAYYETIDATCDVEDFETHVKCSLFQPNVAVDQFKNFSCEPTAQEAGAGCYCYFENDEPKQKQVTQCKTTPIGC